MKILDLEPIGSDDIQYQELVISDGIRQDWSTVTKIIDTIHSLPLCGSRMQSSKTDDKYCLW